MQPSYYNTATKLVLRHKPSTQPRAMDWYSWLVKTALDPSLVYEYSLAFSRNELQREDLPYLNHEFLQSMGISVAKHRLEILKLARKEVGEAEPSNTSLSSKLILAINKTKKCLNKYVNKLVTHHDHHQSNNAVKPLPVAVPEPVRYRDQLKGALMATKCKSEKEVMRIEQPVRRTSWKIAKSGPLDYRGNEKLLVPPRSLKLSGPLDRKMQEKYLVFNNRSPVKSGPIDIAIAQQRLMIPNKLSGPLNHIRTPSPKIHSDYKEDGVDYGDHTLWASMFQDLKPT